MKPKKRRSASGDRIRLKRYTTLPFPTYRGENFAKCCYLHKSYTCRVHRNDIIDTRSTHSLTYNIIHATGR